MNAERAARVALEMWRAGAKTTERLLTLCDHMAYQYRLDAATVYALALSDRTTTETHGGRS